MTETEKKLTRAEMIARARAEDATPDDQLTEEQRARKEARKTKANQRAAEKAVQQALTTEDQQVWFEQNRKTLKPQELEMMQQQHDYIHALLDSMLEVVNVQSDPELIDIVVNFVKQNPCPHLGYIFRNSDIPSDWSTGVFTGGKYWQNQTLLAKLYGEGPATERYVKYGFLSSFPDWQVENFLTKAGWTWSDVAKLLHYHIDNQNQEVSYR